VHYKLAFTDSLQWPDPLKEKSIFSQKLRHLEPFRRFYFPKKVSCTRVRYRKFASNAEKAIFLIEKVENPQSVIFEYFLNRSSTKFH
jgi:hypothetical protein